MMPGSKVDSNVCLYIVICQLCPQNTHMKQICCMDLKFWKLASCYEVRD